jgi:hypothetical protein
MRFSERGSVIMLDLLKEQRFVGQHIFEFRNRFIVLFPSTAWQDISKQQYDS